MLLVLAPLLELVCNLHDIIDADLITHFAIAPAAAADAGGAAAPAAAAKVEVEEVDALEGGMDMFGGDAGGGDY